MRIHLLPIALLASCACAIGAQSNQPATPSVIMHRHVPPENSWRSEAKDLSTEGDTVSPDIRKIRDARWDSAFQVLAGSSSIGVSSGGSGLYTPRTGPPTEFERVNDYTWIIGRFETFHVYRTSGGRGLYTEMNIRVQHVFVGDPHPGLSEGQLIDMPIIGGAATSNGKRIESSLIDDYTPHIQPGHTYLMQVISCERQKEFNCSGGDYYNPGRKWDLTSGVVQPVGEFDVRFAATGKSSIDGTPASTIIPRFQAILDQSAQDGSK